MRPYLVIGVVAILVWFSLFTAGVTIDSSPFRKALAAAGTTPARSEGSLAAVAGPVGVADGIPNLSRLTAFLGVMAFYTPMNVALLTLLAGLVGGCASRLTFARAHKEGAPAGEGASEDLRTVFRTENPVASMLRSFLVYLAFIAGIFVTTNDPFGNPTPDQYVRIAGLLSFVSFVVGYDPTKFQDILSLRPGGRGK